MVRVQVLTNTGVLSSGIILITEIECTCHLIPDFGKAIPRGWLSLNVLDVGKYFYINPYLHHCDFYILQYCIYLQEKREKEKLEELARKHARAAC
jgi:hypothetical protein